MNGPSCPFCHGSNTDLLAFFGSKLLVAQYWCRHCRTGFERVRDMGVGARNSNSKEEFRDLRG